LITNYCKKLQWQQFPCLSMASLQDKCRWRHGGSTWSLLIWIELSLLLHLLHRSCICADTFVRTETFVHHWRSGLPLSHLSHTGTSLVWFDASFSTSKTCIQTNCQMSRLFWFISFVLVMCVMCGSQKNRIPSWKKGRGSVLSEVLQLVQVSHMSLLLQSGVLCSNTTGSLFHSIWVSQGGQGGTSNHHESLASHPNPCIPVVPVYTCVCY
jgi:hypothetical protein